MRSLPILATLLCMLLCAAAAQAQKKDNSNTMKLCGRAFLRAVVYTCGGSRWRRLMRDEQMLPEGSTEPEVRTAGATALDRQWRDQNQALISVCCEVGCRRSDLSMLC